MSDILILIIFSMKKLIFTKFYKEITNFFIVSLILTGLIVWTIQAVNYFDFVTEDGHGIKIYFLYSLLNFPNIVTKIYPFIFFITIFYIIFNYEIKNEISILWINGIKKIKFVNNLLVLSLVFMLIQLILSSYISPLTKLKARGYIKNSNINFFTSLIKEGSFINATKGLTIFIDKKEKDGTFKNIFLEEKNKNKSRIIYASNGELLDNDFQKTFRLFKGQIIDSHDSEINIFNFDEINFNLNDLNTRTIITPKLQEIDTVILLSCFFKIKNKKFGSFNCNENLIKEVKIELINRLYRPINLPIIVLLASYLILFSKNQKSYKINVNIIFFMIFLFLVFFEVSANYAVLSKSLMFAYLFSPIIIFIIGYYYLSRLCKNV